MIAEDGEFAKVQPKPQWAVAAGSAGMNDCVYVAWAEAAKDLGVRPKEGSRQIFDLAKSLFGEPEGLWGGAAPLVLGLLCRMHELAISVRCHGWFNRAYYAAAANSDWQRWAVAAWGNRRFWKQLSSSPNCSQQGSKGSIYFWLGGHHAYYSSKPDPNRFAVMIIRLYRREEVQ